MGFALGLTVASTAATLLGTGLSAAGAIQEGKAEAASQRYQAQVARNNQIIANRAASDAIERGKIEEGNTRSASKQLIARQRAALAANGVDVGTGSALALQGDAAMFGELDALTVRSNAEREALGYRTQGMNFEADSELLTSRSRSSRSAGYAAAGGLLFRGGAQVASTWYDYAKLT